MRKDTRFAWSSNFSRFTLFCLFLLLAAAPVWAQVPQLVTVRQINALRQTAVDSLNASGAALDRSLIGPLTETAFANQEVRITVVVLSDPRTSGLSHPDAEGFPSHITVYVRDTSAVSQGNAGMGIELVDGAYLNTGLLNAAIGDVLTVVGTPGVFTGAGGSVMQFLPTTVTPVGTHTDFGLPESILDPVVITTEQANMSVGNNGEVQVNWSNLASLNGQYVRLEGATVQLRDISTARPNWLITTDGGATVLNVFDLSLRYRNDRDGGYDDTEFNVRDDDFVPPPQGTSVNIQGFLIFQGDDPFNRGLPPGRLLSIVPFEDADVEDFERSPVASTPKLASVPAAGEATTVTSTASADPARTLTSVTLKYCTSAAAECTGGNWFPANLPMTDQGDGTFSADIPGQAEGTFVILTGVTAIDNTGDNSTSAPQEYRVLSDGIDEIADIQVPSGFAGDASPFAGLTLAMNLTATVQNNPAVHGREIAIQDDATLGPWTGIIVEPTNERIADLQPGDVINITSARMVEDGGVTQLRDLVYTTTSEGGNILGYRVATTQELQDALVAEVFEGMLLLIDDPVVTSVNPDAPNGPFGEWAVSSDGNAAHQIRVDDRSNGIDFRGDDAGTIFSVGQRLDFIRGVWWFSSSNYKLMPDDLSTDVDTARDADLALTKEMTGYDEAQGSARVTYTLTLTNHGPVTATDVQVSESLPQNVTFLSEAPSQGSYADGVWEVGTLAVDATATLDITVDTSTPAEITNLAEVLVPLSFEDPDLTNNADTVTITLESADLELELEHFKEDIQNADVLDPSKFLSERVIIRMRTRLRNRGPGKAGHPSKAGRFAQEDSIKVTFCMDPAFVLLADSSRLSSGTTYNDATRT